MPSENFFGGRRHFIKKRNIGLQSYFHYNNIIIDLCNIMLLISKRLPTFIFNLSRIYGKREVKQFKSFAVNNI